MRYKGLSLSWQMVADAHNQPDVFCVKLTQGEIIALVSHLEFLRWPTRWISPPDRDTITAFADELEHKLMGCGCFDCDSVAACIEESESVRDALERYLATSEYLREIERAIERMNGTGFLPEIGQGCDLDALFGSITDVFDELYASGLDWLEILDASSQFTEVMSRWGEELTAVLAAVGAVPATISGALLIVSNVVEQWLDDAIQAYRAGYTTELRDTLRCEYFCRVKDDCTYSAADILEWLQAELRPDVDTVLELLSWYFLGGFSGRTAVLAMWYFELSLYKFAITNRLGNMLAGGPATDAMVRLQRVSLAADPDPDHAIYCDCPTEEPYESDCDFTVSQCGWMPRYTDYANWITGIGWRYKVGNPTRLVIMTDAAIPANITSVTVEFNLQTWIVPATGTVYLFQVPADGGNPDVSDSGVVVYEAGDTVTDFTQVVNYPAGYRLALGITSNSGFFPPNIPEAFAVKRILINGVIYG